MPEVRLLTLGDRGLLVQFGMGISLRDNLRVYRLAAALEEAGLPGVEELVPAYASLLVLYNPLVVEGEALARRLEEWIREADLEEPGTGSLGATVTGGRLVEVPVAYGGDYGPDLEEVAARCGLAPAEVVAIHTSRVYRVFCLGFTPGFAYLGLLDRRLAVPRREEPRPRVPAGSVGIAGRQTGVYPRESPGGWRLIGCSPWQFFRPEKDPPALLAPGDRVRFKAISQGEFERLATIAGQPAARGAGSPWP